MGKFTMRRFVQLYIHVQVLSSQCKRNLRGNLKFKNLLYAWLKLHISKTKCDVDFVTAHPKIKISSSADTVIPGNKGDVVTLICTFSGKPLPRPSWRRQLNGTDLGVFNGSYVKNISQKNNSSFLNVIVNNTGEHFYCVVSNLLGSDNLTYTIRRRGT